MMRWSLLGLLMSCGIGGRGKLKFSIWELCPIFVVVRVIAKRTLREFWKEHPDVEVAIQTWYDVAKGADWSTPNELKSQYGNASILPDNRAVFNIKGNDYRLVVLINYVKQIIYIRFIGFHKDYDAIDATTI